MSTILCLAWLSTGKCGGWPIRTLGSKLKNATLVILNYLFLLSDIAAWFAKAVLNRACEISLTCSCAHMRVQLCTYLYTAPACLCHSHEEETWNTQAQLASAHSLFLCAHDLVYAIYLGVHDLSLCFANKLATSLPGRRETEYSAATSFDMTIVIKGGRPQDVTAQQNFLLSPKKWNIKREMQWLCCCHISMTTTMTCKIARTQKIRPISLLKYSAIFLALFYIHGNEYDLSNC